MHPELLEKANAATSLIEPSDLHGTVCGIAAANPLAFSLPMLIDLLGTDALHDEVSAEAFVAASLDLLFAQDMEFHPLIPDDDEPMSARLGGIAVWCAGFLSGFGSTMQVDAVELPNEVEEILRDFVNISGVDEEAAETEQNEESFMEIYEYVRVGAILTVTLMREVVEAQSSDDHGDELQADHDGGGTLH